MKNTIIFPCFKKKSYFCVIFYLLKAPKGGKWVEETVKLNEEYIDQLSNQGQWNQLAVAFLDEIKNREISPENSEKLIPLSTNFVTEMTSLIRAQIESDKESYKAYMAAINSIIEGLNRVLADGQIDKEERKDISNKLLEMGKIMSEVEKSRNQESEKTKRFIGLLMTIGVVVVVILTAGKYKPKINV